MRPRPSRALCGLTGASALVLGSCTRPSAPPAARVGDEIVICGRMFHTGAPVVLWTDPGGYDAYREERWFADPAQSTPGTPAAASVERPAVGSGRRYGSRDSLLSTAELDRVKTDGWTLDLLREHVDQFVIHYDACGTSRACFRVLHDVRGLSVHFLLDLDGTIYQTLDVKERAWHATTSNDRSVGVEIANIGAFAVGGPDAPASAILDRWYRQDAEGWRVTIPPEMGDGGVRTPGFVARPARDGPVVGEIQGKLLRMHDLTPQQYDSLARLTATLCAALPRIACDYPRDSAGNVITGKLSDERLKEYRGLIGHYHIQENKTDPGPAFQWQHLIDQARQSHRTQGLQPLGSHLPISETVTRAQVPPTWVLSCAPRARYLPAHGPLERLVSRHGEHLRVLAPRR